MSEEPKPEKPEGRPDEHRACRVSGALFKRLCILAFREGRTTTNLINYVLWRACESAGLRKLMTEEELKAWCTENGVDIVEIDKRYEAYREKWKRGVGRAFGHPEKRD